MATLEWVRFGVGAAFLLGGLLTFAFELLGVFRFLKQLNDNFLSVDVCKNGEILATSTFYRTTLYFYDESKKELISLGYC